MGDVLFGALLLGRRAVIVLFAMLSFLALREMVTLTYTRRADHRTLFWIFFIVTPLQYALIEAEWYGLFAVFIPVYGFTLVALLGTLRGDPQRYLERTAKMFLALMICVYGVSHLPALLLLPVAPDGSPGVGLLLFLLVVVQLSDVLQYVWGKTLGRRPIAPHLSPNKTWAGAVGGILTATGVGAALGRLTPFTPAQAAAMALAACVLGFFGGLIMSAIKRDAGVKDFGALLAGHGGVLDRIDSLCFAAPVFFHVTRYYFT